MIFVHLIAHVMYTYPNFYHIKFCKSVQRGYEKIMTHLFIIDINLNYKVLFIFCINVENEKKKIVKDF